MKAYLKNWWGDNHLLLLTAVAVLALFVRFYNFENRITFGPEQAISLITSGDMIQNDISLLGQENVQRVTSHGHIIFSGVLFSYTLIPLQILFSYNPISITGYFALLNILTGILIYFLGKQLVSKRIALIASILFLFNFWMIYHSMFIWILNYLPLIGLVTIYLLKQKLSIKNIFYISVLSGLAVSLEYLYIVFSLLTLTYLLAKSKSKIKVFIAFILGNLIGLLPTVLFDLKHDFYHLRTLTQYALDVFHSTSNSKIDYYHFLPLFPLVFLVIAFLLSKYIKNIFVLSLIVFSYIFINLSSPLVSFKHPIGMPEDLTWKQINTFSGAIVENNPQNYNVATLIDFDSRGHVLRYPLTFIFNQSILGPEDYPVADQLFVIADPNYKFHESQNWEVNSLSPFKVDKIDQTAGGHALFKLTRL